jgi:hypothetical protein
MDKIEKMIGMIKANGDDVWVAGPQPEKAVADLEHKLGYKLPPSYRSFLLRYGSLKIFDTVISGIVDGHFEGEGDGLVLHDTERCREENHLPRHLLVVQPDEDAPYCLATSTPDTKGEFPLVCYDLQTGDIDPIAGNFGAWLLDTLKAQVED